ncbi:MAG: lysine--tRNA ligase [Candidatus Shapirobacteria bacterium]|jgi:lysyl-tRNA synthetase class 2
MSDLVKQRQDKLVELKQRGFDPYPQPNLEVKQSCALACQSEGQSVTVAGRLMSLRGHGKIMFADLHDLSGKIQLFFEKNTLGESMSVAKLFDLGDIVSATGTVFKTNAGEITIRVSQFQILAKNLRPLPEKWHGLTDTEERYRQRYVDLIVNPESREVFLTRTKILSAMRKFLDDHGFIEVETPILQPVYGGASAKPFITHHNELEQDMYLRISDELYLKRLIVGGLEKVYEVSRDFRNESVSRFHNPEFTQIEFYWAYVDYDVLMRFTEELVTNIAKMVKGSLKFSFNGQELDFTPPFKRLTFRDAILEKTGIDIDQIHSEDEFFKALEIGNLKLEIADAVGLGALFDALYKETVRPFLIGPVFITDYPAEMIALAKRKADNPKKIASFQLLACGTELLKAYNELNDPKDQSDRWLEEAKLEARGAQNAMQMDTDYIRALEYGMPPTAGWGMGIDRFTQFLTDTPTIKDVILFPSLRSEKETTSENDLIGLNSQKVVIGQVIAIRPHPNADKLKIYDVKISSDLNLAIISGCQNLKDNDIVAVAMPGAIVFAPENKTQKIKPTKMRGVDSPAMMCSPLELGVNPNHETIFVLPADLSAHLGEPVSKYYSVTK